MACHDESHDMPDFVHRYASSTPLYLASDHGLCRSCKALGLVIDNLEERNEMSETPLIREAATGYPRYVRLLLEAGAEVEEKQQNEMGFNALNMAVCRIIYHL